MIPLIPPIFTKSVYNIIYLDNTMYHLYFGGVVSAYYINHDYLGQNRIVYNSLILVIIMAIG